MNVTRALAVVFGMVVSASAGAVTWGHDAGGSNLNNNVAIGVSGLGGSIYCSSVSTYACNTSGSGLGGSVIRVMAYGTPTNTGNQTSNPVETGTWVQSKIALTNINSTGTGFAITGADDAGTAPEIAIDNNGVDDILVIDFQSDGWNVNSFRVGYACNASTGTCGSAVDLSAWVSDTLPTSFSGNNGTAVPVGTNVSALTFSSGEPGGQDVQRIVNSPVTSSRYLIITGDTNRYIDAFTIKGLSATFTPPGGQGQAPVPGSVPLVALGLLAMTWVYRRRTVPIRR